MVWRIEKTEKMKWVEWVGQTGVLGSNKFVYLLNKISKFGDSKLPNAENATAQPLNTNFYRKINLSNNFEIFHA